MPRQPDPDLEERILKAADALYRRGGEKALTMRSVAKAAGTNTPAMYRRFKNREDLLKGLLLRTTVRLGVLFEKAQTLENMCEAYIDFALSNPHEYELFYSHGPVLDPRRGRKLPVPPLRQMRPNFALVERTAAKELGGRPEDYTVLTLQTWALVHGAAMLMLTKSIPPEHDDELRQACRQAVIALIEDARKSPARR